jgi:hypothetical protein
LGLPSQGYQYRVVGVHGFPLVVALVQADTTAGLEIDGGDYFQS